VRIYEPRAGETIDRTAMIIMELARAQDDQITADFNGIELTANPGDNAESIASYYRQEMDRRHQEYINSPEYAEQQRKAEEAQRNNQLVLQGAISVSPDKMTLRDEEAFRRYIDVNTDPYGAAITKYADLWARLMEGRMSNGDTLEGCAEEASQIADNEGITGFMYGAAVGFLAQCWIHGEELRRWHNLKTQIGDEGEKAN
jgi:hypothetical protein